MTAVGSASSDGAGMRRGLDASSSIGGGASSSSAASERELLSYALLEKFFSPQLVSSLEDRDIKALFSDGGFTFRDLKGEIWTVEIMTIAKKTDRLFVKAYKKGTFSGIFLREVHPPMAEPLIVTEIIHQEGASRPEREQSVVKSLDARPKFPFEEALAHIMERMESSEMPNMTLDDKVEAFIKDYSNMGSKALLKGTSFAELLMYYSQEDRRALDAIVNRLPLKSQKDLKSLITELGKQGVWIENLKRLGREYVQECIEFERERTEMRESWTQLLERVGKLARNQKITNIKYTVSIIMICCSVILALFS